MCCKAHKLRNGERIRKSPTSAGRSVETKKLRFNPHLTPLTCEVFQRNNPTIIPTSRRRLRAAKLRGLFVALLNLLILASSCSTSSSTHAPTLASSSVLYNSNGNYFMLHALPSECRITVLLDRVVVLIPRSRVGLGLQNHTHMGQAGYWTPTAVSYFSRPLSCALF